MASRSLVLGGLKKGFLFVAKLFTKSAIDHVYIMPLISVLVNVVRLPSTLDIRWLNIPPLSGDSGGFGRCTRTLSACGNLINYLRLGLNILGRKLFYIHLD